MLIRSRLYPYHVGNSRLPAVPVEEFKLHPGETLAGGLRRRGSAMRVRHIVEVLDEAYHPVHY